MLSRSLRSLAALLLIAAPAMAAADTPSGLPLPRFVTTRSTPINVRVGPGTRYDVTWVYKVAGTPVEIIQEFDTWRKIRDVDGSEGWVHQNMLSGSRAGIVQGNAGDEIGLRAAAAEDATVIAWVGPGFPVKISSCEAGWCAVVATDHAGGDHGANYSGYLPETALWGVYQGENFD